MAYGSLFGEFMRILFLFSVIFIAGCAESAYSTSQAHDPEFANLQAIATQTAVQARREATASSQVATNDAAKVRQTAVAYNATSTQIAIATQTAVASTLATQETATETAVYAPMALQQTTEAQAVLMQRANAESTATAVALTAKMASNARAAERMDLFWSVITYGIAGLIVVVILVLGGKGFRYLSPVATVYHDDGTVAAYAKDHYEQVKIGRSTRAQIPHADVIDNPPQAELPSNNIGKRPLPINYGNDKKAMPVTDKTSAIGEKEWFSFAYGLLVTQLVFSRGGENGIVKNTIISQPKYNRIYGELKDAGMIGDGEEDKLNAHGYDYLFNLLNDEEKQKVRLPHPDSLITDGPAR